ncbi:MAG: hypothetical protein LVQ96_01165 [Thermoplasmatales archaeon]|nr:hypothetical protein [Thermoplasmatales archaeon]MCW6169765.1 hypothetical protein [Thermoplasmatales archaeon]
MKEFEKIIVAVAIALVVVSAYFAVNIYYSDLNQPKKIPSNIIALKGTQYNLSAANGWSIGTGSSYNSNVSGTIVGSWNSTKLTALVIWVGYNKSEQANLDKNATYSHGESLDLSISAGHYTFLFTTKSSDDTVTIVQNITFLPNSH